MKKSVLIALSVSAAVFVGLVAAGTFCDLQLSQALYYKDSVFGRFFTAFGYAPIYLGTALSALILFRAVGRTNKFFKWLKPLCGVLYLAASYLLCWWFTDTFFLPGVLNYLYAAVMALAFFAAGLFSTRKIEKKYFDRLMVVAAVFLVASAVSQGLIELLKYLWTRQSFSTLAVANGLIGTEGYTPWYLPNAGQNDPINLVYDGENAEAFYRAFPSGFAAAFAALEALTLLPEVFPSAKKYVGYFYAIPVALVVLVSFAEIVSGNAYLTDVTFGAAIGAGVTFGTKALLKNLWIKRRLIGSDAFFEEGV